MFWDSKHELFHTHDVLLDFYTHINTTIYSTFDRNYILQYQIYINNRIK